MEHKVALTKTPIVKFLFRQEWGTLNQFLKGADERAIHSFEVADELMDFSFTQDSLLVLASLANKEDLVQVANLVKALQKERRPLIKLVVTDFSGHPAVEKIINKLGIQDIITTDIQEKAFNFKMEFWLKTLDGQLRALSIEKEDFKAFRGTRSIDRDEDRNSFKTQSIEDLESFEADAPSLNMDELTLGAMVKSYLWRDNKEIECHLDDLAENSFIFNVGNEFFQLGDNVEYSIDLTYKNRHFKLKASGRVIFLHFNEDDGNLFVTVEAADLSVSDQNKFMEIYQERQQAINLFLCAAKGR